MITQLTTRTEPARRLAGIRHVGPCNEVGAAFQKLLHVLSEGNLWAQSGAWAGCYPADITDPSDPTNVSFAACVFTGDLPGGMEWVDLPEARVAVYLHEGPYDDLPQAWMAAYGAVEAASGQVKRGWAVEVYLNDPSDTAPADLKTEILLPLA